MPFYSFNRQHTTSGTTNTIINVFRLLTGNNNCYLTGLYGTARSATAGGGHIHAQRSGGAASGGTAIAPPDGGTAVGANRDPDAATSTTLIFTEASAITSGTAPVIEASVGFAQTGGMGGWVASERDNAIKLTFGAVAAKSSLVIQSIAVGTSIPVAITGEYSEG